MVLSKTNTDTLCLDTDGRGVFIQKALYRYNLWTGMYMLEPHERWALNILFSILATMGCLYTFVFWKGFLDGWNAQHWLKKLLNERGASYTYSHCAIIAFYLVGTWDIAEWNPFMEGFNWRQSLQKKSYVLVWYSQNSRTAIRSHHFSSKSGDQSSPYVSEFTTRTNE